MVHIVTMRSQIYQSLDANNKRLSMFVKIDLYIYKRVVHSENLKKFSIRSIILIINKMVWKRSKHNICIISIALLRYCNENNVDRFVNVYKKARVVSLNRTGIPLRTTASIYVELFV